LLKQVRKPAKAAVLHDSLQTIALTLRTIKHVGRAGLCLFAICCNLTLFQKTIANAASLFLAPEPEANGKIDRQKVIDVVQHAVQEDGGLQKIAYGYCF
jgi:hypothetical protein